MPVHLLVGFNFLRMKSARDSILFLRPLPFCVFHTHPSGRGFAALCSANIGAYPPLSGRRRGSGCMRSGFGFSPCPGSFTREPAIPDEVRRLQGPGDLFARIIQYLLKRVGHAACRNHLLFFCPADPMAHVRSQTHAPSPLSSGDETSPRRRRRDNAFTGSNVFLKHTRVRISAFWSPPAFFVSQLSFASPEVIHSDHRLR